MALITSVVRWLFRTLTAIPKLAFVLLLLASLAFNVATLTVSAVYSAASSALTGMGVATVAAREAGEKLALRGAIDLAERKAAEEAAEKLALRNSLQKAERKAAQEAGEKLALRQSLERSERLAARRLDQKNAVRKIGLDTADRAQRRVQRGAARNISSAAGEAIPFLGVAVVAGALAFEIQDACDTARDMAGFEAALMAETDPDLAHQAAVEGFDCVEMIREELPSYEDLPTKEALWDDVVSSPGKAWEQAVELNEDLAKYNWSGLTLLVWESSMKWIEERMERFSGEKESSP